MLFRTISLSLFNAFELVHTSACEKKEVINIYDPPLVRNFYRYTKLIDKTVDCLTEIDKQLKYDVFMILIFKDGSQRLNYPENDQRNMVLTFKDMIKFLKYVKIRNVARKVNRFESNGTSNIENETKNFEEKIKEVEEIKNNFSVKNQFKMQSLIKYIITHDILNNTHVGLKEDLEKLINDKTAEDFGLDETKIKILISVIDAFGVIRLDMSYAFDKESVDKKLSGDSSFNFNSPHNTASNISALYLYVDDEYARLKRYESIIEQEKENKIKAEEQRKIQERLLLEQQRRKKNNHDYNNMINNDNNYYYNN